MQLPELVNTFGHSIQKRFGHKVHKLTINANFTCPNRDGVKGRGGCSFCNNASFNPNTTQKIDIEKQLKSGSKVVVKRTGAKKYIAYFQAYTNTYADVSSLDELYQSVLERENVIGISVGTRPDCLPIEVMELLQKYRDAGHFVCLELGLQSANNKTLENVNRGHDFNDYLQAIAKVRKYNIDICTHLIVGLPGENPEESLITLNKVLDAGVNGLKLHPLHVVKNTTLAKQWQNNKYTPLDMKDYVNVAAEMIRNTPAEIVFHRITGTAKRDILLAPEWCSKKWIVLNRIAENLHQFGAQGYNTNSPFRGK